MLAVDEINAAGGVKGRQIKIEHHDCDIFTPDGIQAGYRAVVDTKPHAIGCAFVPLARQTMLEALGDYKAPLLTGDTNIDLITFAMKNRAKYWNYFQVDPPEIYYGQMFPKFLDTIAAGGGVEAEQQQGPHHPRAEQLQHADCQGSRGNAAVEQVRARQDHRHPVPGAGLGPGDAGRSRR